MNGLGLVNRIIPGMTMEEPNAGILDEIDIVPTLTPGSTTIQQAPVVTDEIIIDGSTIYTNLKPSEIIKSALIDPTDNLIDEPAPVINDPYKEARELMEEVDVTFQPLDPTINDDASGSRFDELDNLINDADITPHIPIINIEDNTMTKEIADESKEQFDELEDLINNADITPHIPIINIEDNTITPEIADESKERFDELDEAITYAEPVTTSPTNFDDGMYNYSPNAGGGNFLQPHEDDGPGGISYDQNGNLVEAAPAQASMGASSLKGLVMAGAAVALLSVFFKGEGAGDKMLKSRKSGAASLPARQGSQKKTSLKGTSTMVMN